MKQAIIVLAVWAVCMGASGIESAFQPLYESPPGSVPPGNRIDALVRAELEERGIEPAYPSSDEVFIRRAFLDVIGTLPQPGEIRRFLNDPRPNKRAILIDTLLERDEFADYWSLKWCDLLRVKAEFPINLWPNAVQAYHMWIRNAIRTNMPYDEFARALLTSSGSNYREPPVNFYRAVQGQEPEALAAAVALTFMGARIENWTKDERDAMAAFFSRLAFKDTAEWKEEIVHLDPSVNEPLDAIYPDGQPVRIAPGEDPREAFADWLISPDNDYFSHTIVNRVWAWLLGRGIVHEPDDFRPDNPPANPALLAYLAEELAAADYDLRHLYRLILNSRTYQQSSIPRSDHPEAEAQFAHYIVRQLDAEVLIDALNWIFGSRESYSSMIPEPFTFIPEQQRSILLADGSITSPFLEMFGRPPRDTGLASERRNEPTERQRLHLLNSTHIQRKIERSWRLRQLLENSQGEPRRAIIMMYLFILSRHPSEEEIAAVQAYVQDGGVTAQQAASDLAWALINTKEFLYRH